MKTQPPRILIPSDWDGESWECFQIQWPNSPEWLAVLRGLVTLPMRGRNWDETSGSIRDVQRIGFLIENANIPLTTCDGEAVPGETVTPETIRFIYGDESEENMGWVCGVNPEAFRIVDGVLEVRNFCGDWVAIGALTPPTDYPPDDPWSPIDPPPTFSGCGKITSLIDYMVALSSAIWSHYDDPVTLESAARAAVPPATLSRSRIYQWMASIVLLDDLGLDQSDFENENAIQAAKCYAVAIATDTSTGTEDEKEACEEGMATSFYNIVGLMDKAQWKAYWHAIQETIGDQDCRLLLTLGATNTDAECDCPDLTPNAPTEPDENGWYWSERQSMTVESVGDYSTYMCFKHSMEQDVFGWRFVLERDDNNKNYKRMSASTASCADFDEDAWGNTSDHLEYASSTFVWCGGKLTLLQTLFAEEGLTETTEWDRQSSNYADSDDPATPSYVQGTIVNHAFEGVSMTSGDTYTVKMRWLMNINSPSHL